MATVNSSDESEGHVTPDLQLDPLTGDLLISDLGVASLTSDLLTEVAQRLTTKFKFFLGEWFLDQRKGIAFFRDVFVRNPDMAVIKATLQDVVTSDAGVDHLVSLELDLDPATRVLSVDFAAVLISEETLALTVTGGV